MSESTASAQNLRSAPTSVEYGVMCPADRMDNQQLSAYARGAEEAGIDTIWVPELYGRDPFVTCALILGATRNVRVGTAIANVYVRDARATKAAALPLRSSTAQIYRPNTKCEPSLATRQSQRLKLFPQRDPNWPKQIWTTLKAFDQPLPGPMVSSL